ncbi:MAG TPA: cobalamin B12-binding domain-containing protein [Actinocrinis sp.]|nr:cobalamin B12-binding domain-containing protein [Actinocrinis sp.]
MLNGIRYILFVNAQDTTRHVSSANTAIYPNLGLLTLMTAVEQRLQSADFRLGYFDGTVHGNLALEQFIDENAGSIAAVCFSALTANYGASLALAERAKRLNPTVITIFGNDHFSALYKQVMRNRACVDYGFYGNDVVEGFGAFVTDCLLGSIDDLSTYAGLVYRQPSGEITANPENPAEYGELSAPNYALIDSLMPHRKHYLEGQQKTYFFMRSRELRSQVVDIGRGCIKFAGPRLEGIPLNACDFCGIIPGVKEISSPDAAKAWAILHNAYEHGYNYFYVIADELPLTLWPMLRDMAADIPSWFSSLSSDERPKMFGYARAEAFAIAPDRIKVLIEDLGFDHFFIGFDGLTEISLLVMNKQPVGGRGRAENPMEHNLRAFDDMVTRGGMITAGLVLTHLGITPALLEENYNALARIVNSHPKTFAALDFGPLCPIPGSQSFRYLTHPEYAEARAEKFGLRVNRDYLESRKEYYREADDFDMNELIEDFTIGCCPDITPKQVDDHIARITELADRYEIVVGGGV